MHRLSRLISLLFLLLGVPLFSAGCGSPPPTPMTYPFVEVLLENLPAAVKQVQVDATFGSKTRTEVFSDNDMLQRITISLPPDGRGPLDMQVTVRDAGGFQAGERTTIRFSFGTVPGMGRTLTHELTHRFDGALYPGLPAWLAEGKAVWTGGAYGASTAPEFVETYASIGTIEGAFVKGYGDPTKLAKLIDGTIDDYRDNYVAGNALYVYLRSRKDASGRLLFRDALRVFQEDRKSVV